MRESNIAYRAGQPADAARIVDFQVAMAVETEEVDLDRAVCELGVEAVFREPTHGRYFVAVSEETVVASLMLTFEWSDWRNGLVWWIQSVYVIPQFRRRGVYAGLYDHVKELAMRDPAIRGIRLYVDRRNERAQNVYTRLGMNGEHYQVFEWMK